MLTISDAVKEKYPDLHFGIMMIENVQNPKSNPTLNQMKKNLEIELREKYNHLDKQALKSLSQIQAYNEFYKTFKKTYHVQHQIESIVFKDKDLPNVAALVEAMFMVEVKNLLLTAGYDYGKVKNALQVDLSDGNQVFTGMGMSPKKPPKNDIILCDQQDILGSIICGPDHSSRISPETTQVLFAVYGVPGITEQAIHNHLLDIEHHVSVISPNAITRYISIK